MSKPLPVLAAAAAALLLLSACDFNVTIGDEDITGSGQVESRTFDFDSIDQVEIGSGLSGSITVNPAAPQSIEISMDDNLFDVLVVEENGGVLDVKFEDGTSVTTRNPMDVTVVVTDLSAVDVSGAAFVGVQANESNIQRLDVSGASSLNVGNVKSDNLAIDVSGASELNVAGSADQVMVDASGSSSVSLRSLTTSRSVEVDASGVSDVEIGTAESVRGSASGVSNISVAPESTVDIETSGGAGVERR